MPLSSCVATASDGPNIMLGKHSGIVVRMKAHNKELLQTQSTFVHFRTYRHTTVLTYRLAGVQAYRLTDVHTYTRTDVQTYRRIDLHILVLSCGCHGRCSTLKISIILCLSYVYPMCLKDMLNIHCSQVHTYTGIGVQTYRRTHVHTYRRTLPDVQTYNSTDLQTGRRAGVQTYRRTHVHT